MLHELIIGDVKPVLPIYVPTVCASWENRKWYSLLSFSLMGNSAVLYHPSLGSSLFILVPHSHDQLSPSLRSFLPLSQTHSHTHTQTCTPAAHRLGNKLKRRAKKIWPRSPGACRFGLPIFLLFLKGVIEAVGVFAVTTAGSICPHNMSRHRSTFRHSGNKSHSCREIDTRLCFKFARPWRQLSEISDRSLVDRPAGDSEQLHTAQVTPGEAEIRPSSIPSCGFHVIRSVSRHTR